MGRPTDRAGLLAAVESEFAKLHTSVGQVPEDLREVSGACEHWSVKDILAHLDAWHGMFLGWAADGSTGTKPEMPAPGYGWSDTPALNHAIYLRFANDTWSDVTSRLHNSHRKITGVIAAYSDGELFTKKKYSWTGSTSVGSYAVSATSSHYAWATKLIRKFAKANA